MEGFYNIEELEDIEEIKIDTPFGKPSDSFRLVKMEMRLFFLQGMKKTFYTLRSPLSSKYLGDEVTRCEMDYISICSGS